MSERGPETGGPVDPDHAAETSAAEGSPHSTAPAQVESRALWAGGIAALVALAVGLIGFDGYRPPLWGDRSVAVSRR